MVQTTRSSAVLNSSNLVMYVPCSGTSSATVHIKGTLSATLTVSGGPDVNNTVGPRMLMQAGVGSLGRHVLRVNGAIDKEFRIATGSDVVKIALSNYVSGSVTVDIVCTEDPSILFINGPVHGADEQAARAGRGFVSAPSGQNVQAGNVLAFTLSNPAGSGRNILITNRKFAALASEDVEYLAYVNPTITLTQISASNNRFLGDTATAVGVFRWQTGTAASIVMGGTQASGEPIPNNGVAVNRQLLVILPPGTTLGFTITGSGNNLQNSARLFATIEWFEEDTYS